MDYQSENRQSDHAERHQQVLQELIASGKVYRNLAGADEVKAWKAAPGAERGFRGQEQEQGSYRL